MNLELPENQATQKNNRELMCFKVEFIHIVKETMFDKLLQNETETAAKVL